MPYSNMVSMPAIVARRLTPIRGISATEIMRSILRYVPLSSSTVTKSDSVTSGFRVGSIGTEVPGARCADCVMFTPGQFLPGGRAVRGVQQIRRFEHSVALGQTASRTTDRIH